MQNDSRRVQDCLRLHVLMSVFCPLIELGGSALRQNPSLCIEPCALTLSVFWLPLQNTILIKSISPATRLSSHLPKGRMSVERKWPCNSVQTVDQRTHFRPCFFWTWQLSAFCNFEAFLCSYFSFLWPCGAECSDVVTPGPHAAAYAMAPNTTNRSHYVWSR